MSFGMDTIRNIVVVLVPMILSLTVHEFAHAWSAYKLGDDTASSQGRMTLNPLAHIDVFGTLIIPIFGALNPGGLALIGWAKPVPVSPNRFRRTITMHKGMLITALAGPASNLIMAFLFAGVAMMLYSDAIDLVGSAPNIHDGRVGAMLHLGLAGFVSDNSHLLSRVGMDSFSPLLMLVGRFMIINVFLAIFNMIPLYPLDGSRMLPLDVQEKMARYTLFIFFGFILVINVAGELLWAPAALVSNLLLGFWGIIF